MPFDPTDPYGLKPKNPYALPTGAPAGAQQSGAINPFAGGGTYDPTKSNPLMTPEALAMFAGTSGDLRELDSLEAQIARADALRGEAGPEGRSNGRIYTAANPMEHIGAGMEKFAAQRQAYNAKYGTKNPDYIEGATDAQGKTLPKRIGGTDALRKQIAEREREFGQLAGKNVGLISE